MEVALTGRTALVLYGSETGNAQDVAEELGRTAERLRFQTRVSDFNSSSLVCDESVTLGILCLSLIPYFQKQVLQYSIVLISISTTGQGDLPANALTFWKALRSVRLRPGCLTPVRFASFGLGDTSYPK
jgi:sulfite reductase alpha subunit-like flavoprotein